MHTLKAPATVAAATALVLALGSPAFADGSGPWGDVNCQQNPSAPECQIVVVDPGGSNSGGGGGGDTSGPLVCHLGGEVVECYSDGWGWLGAGGCYYGKDSGGFMPENEYIKTCYNPATGNFDFGGTVTLFGPPSALAAMAKRAVANLKMPKPQIASNPALNSTQVVHVP